MKRCLTLLCTVTAPIGGVGTTPPGKLIPPTPMGNNPLMDWGVWPLDNGDTGKNDPNVWTNLAAMPEHVAVIAEHKQ